MADLKRDREEGNDTGAMQRIAEHSTQNDSGSSSILMGTSEQYTNEGGQIDYESID